MTRYAASLLVLTSLLSGVNAFTVPLSTASTRLSSAATTTVLHMTALKPAAIPLMDAGKAFARSGEFLIDVTSKIDLYGGALSATGALIRNSGDCIAQAAASARFKTGFELVIDELRESSSQLVEATSKLKLARDEAMADKNKELARLLEQSVPAMDALATSLEDAGRSMMQGKTAKDVGFSLLQCAESMETLSIQIRGYAPEVLESSDAGQRMAFASERMRDAGYELTGTAPDADSKPKGKGWIKG